MGILGWLVLVILSLIVLALLWFFLLKGGKTNLAQRDAQNAWRGFKSFAGPIVSSMKDSAAKHPYIAVLMVLVLVVLFVFFGWPIIHPAPVAWTYGINEDRDRCNPVLVGVVGTDPETGTVYTESSLKALGADLIFDPVTDVGKEVTLWKPGTDLSCAIPLPPLQSSK